MPQRLNRLLDKPSGAPVDASISAVEPERLPYQKSSCLLQRRRHRRPERCRPTRHGDHCRFQRSVFSQRLNADGAGPFGGLHNELCQTVEQRTVGLRWRDAPKEYGPHKTIYNRFIRWSCLGMFNRIFAKLSAKGGKPDRLMIDATHLKAHRTAVSLLKKGAVPRCIKPSPALVCSNSSRSK
jgi:hypothetical protein